MSSTKPMAPSVQFISFWITLVLFPRFLECAKLVSARSGDVGRRRGILPSAVGRKIRLLNFMQDKDLLKSYNTKPNLGKHHEISTTSVSATSNSVEDMEGQDVIPPIVAFDERGDRMSTSSTAASLSTVGGTTTSASAANSGGSSYNRMPSLFLKPEEQYLDKYAACLAATEGLRKLRDSALASTSYATSTATTPIHRVIRKFLPNCGKDVDLQSDLYRQACSEYALNSSKVIRALGLSVAQFNQIGRQISSDPALKEKVMEQAYLYRITATLNMDKVPLIEDPTMRDELFRGANKNKRLQMFAKSMHDIEELRQEQTERLLKALSIDRLPESVNICDPKVLPFLSPQIRAVVEAFPLQAEDIVKKYGLSSDEFNQMLQVANTNKSFRRKVEEQIQRSNEESRLQKVFNN